MSGSVWLAPPSGRNGQTFDSPTFTGIQIGNTYPVSAGGIPLISLSTGSVAANGAISAITALPRIYPDAYCYFPANILAGAIAAGWYYCTFSSTTAGVAFLNTYSSGTPIIPTSPTAVTAGQGAFTGDTTTEVGHLFNIPGGTLGKWGAIRFRMMIECTNNANGKTVTARLGGGGGTTFGVTGPTSVAVAGLHGTIKNTGSEAKQISEFEPFWTNPTTFVSLGTLDTTAQQAVATTVAKATATDNIVLFPPLVEIIRAQ